jgi:predicted MPP superfamily phosphohydrolase
VGKLMLYVNRGIGVSGVPVRFGAPPEVTVVELGCEAWVAKADDD